MAGEITKVLAEAISAFLETVPSSVRYRGMGGDVEIPTSAEMSLVRVFEALFPRCRDDLAPIARGLNVDQSYRVAAFSVRVATLAARTNAIHLLRAGTLGLVVDDNLVDYRDVLMGLSVVDDCTSRLGADLGFVMQDAISVASDRRRDTIVREYLSRLPAWRGIGPMGVEAFGEGETLTYKAKPWW